MHSASQSMSLACFVMHMRVYCICALVHAHPHSNKLTWADSNATGEAFSPEDILGLRRRQRQTFDLAEEEEEEMSGRRTAGRYFSLSLFFSLGESGFERLLLAASCLPFVDQSVMVGNLSASEKRIRRRVLPAGGRIMTDWAGLAGLGGSWSLTACLLVTLLCGYASSSRLPAFLSCVRGKRSAEAGFPSHLRPLTMAWH